MGDDTEISHRGEANQPRIPPKLPLDAATTTGFRRSPNLKTAKAPENAVHDRKTKGLPRNWTDAKLQETTSNLQVLRERLKQVEQDLEAKQEEADELRMRWKQTASELDRFVRQGQGFNQMADDDVVQKTTKLRFNIKSFALQHFGTRIKYSKKTHQQSISFIKQYLRISPQAFDAYMRSSSSRPALVQAFLWHVLCMQIFSQYRWAPGRESRSMSTMCQTFESISDMRKFHMWRATTSTLLSEVLNPREGSDKSFNFIKHLIREISKFLIPFSTSKGHDITAQVTAIFNESTELDEQLSKQVACWCFIEDYSAHTFNPDAMEMEKGQKQAPKGQNVALILAPQLVKMGKSSGDGFDERQTLLKMEVTCEEPAIGKGERGSGFLMQWIYKKGSSKRGKHK